MKKEVKLDLAVYSQVIGLDLCKILRAYVTSNFEDKKTYNFLTKTLAYVVYDFLLSNKNKNFEITKTDLMCIEEKNVLEKDKNYLLLYLGCEVNSQINGSLITFSKIDYKDNGAVLDIIENPENNLENYSIQCHVYLTGVVNISNNSEKIWLSFSDPAKKHYFAVMEYKDHGEDLVYFPGENEFFSFLISKPTRANHFPTVDLPSSVYKEFI